MSIVKPKAGRSKPSEVIAVLRRVFAENGRDYRLPYLLAMGCLLAIAATTAFSAWIVKDVVDEVFYRMRTDLVVVICLAIIAAFAIRGFAGYGQAVILGKIGNNLVARYQRRLFRHLMRLDIGFFTDTRSGHLAAQINQNVVGIRDLLSITLTAFARDIVSLIGLVAVMIYQDPVLSLIVLLVAPPLIVSINYLMRRVRSVSREVVNLNSHLIGAMQEATQGIAIVKAFTMESQLVARLDELISRAEARSNKIVKVSERLGPIADILAGLAVAGVIAYAALRASAAAQPPGAVFSFITAALLAYDPARRLAKAQVGLERALVNVRMIYEILDIEPRQEDEPGAAELKVGRGEIVFDRVSFSYDPSLPVLHEVSLFARAGKVTAIVGASGAGKSTLIALLQRFHDLDGGQIRVDGQDIARVSKHSLRSAIAYVSQQPYLFEGTIGDNIRYGREDATDAEIVAAARLAAAEDFILAQPQGFDTPVGENGVTLSGGQRQRLSIARALVRNAPILLLDEATSALDNESEARVQQALAAVMRERTTIVIAHRLSTVVNADHIVVMEAGRVVEEGTHSQLLGRPNGIYARFFRLQEPDRLALIDDVGLDTGMEAPQKRAPTRGL